MGLFIISDLAYSTKCLQVLIHAACSLLRLSPYVHHSLLHFTAGLINILYNFKYELLDIISLYCL